MADLPAVTGPAHPSRELSRPSQELSRRGTLLLGLTTITSGCSLRWAGSHSPAPDRTPDDYAREAMVWAVTGLKQDSTTLADSPATRRQAVVPLRALAATATAQLAALGPPPDDLASPTRPPAALARVTATAQATTADALQRVDAVTGPMARLLTCVAAGVWTHTAPVVRATGNRMPQPPRAAARGTPPLSDALFLTRAASTTPGRALIPTPPTARLRAALGALSVALRTAEYGYGLAAARLPGSARTAAMDRSALHRRAALGLDALARAASVTLAPAAASYPVAPVSTPAAARALAARLELGCATAAGRVVALLPADAGVARTVMADHLMTSAIGAAAWGVRPALPGAQG